MCVSATIIFVCTNISLSLKFKYPAVTCGLINDDYSVQGNVSSEFQSYQDDAIKEYLINKEYETAGKPTHFTGVMQCFCDWRKDSLDATDMTYALSIDPSLEPVSICQLYTADKLKSKIFGQSVAFIIIIVNLILKTVIIKGITWVGEDTNSEQLSSITNGVFAAQFFNTGFLLLLVNGNMTEHQPKFLT